MTTATTSQPAVPWTAGAATGALPETTPQQLEKALADLEAAKTKWVSVGIADRIRFR